MARRVELEAGNELLDRLSHRIARHSPIKAAELRTLLTTQNPPDVTARDPKPLGQRGRVHTLRS